ncbi:hypothetical protein Scep_010086 [Stephania cephalantha]|uniref:Uncharacterized protein n=1 Tax=Stephania cephalantha TaxID=152367 RepID=A0AAP0JVE3_9MAGN
MMSTNTVSMLRLVMLSLYGFLVLLNTTILGFPISVLCVQVIVEEEEDDDEEELQVEEELGDDEDIIIKPEIREEVEEKIKELKEQLHTQDYYSDSQRGRKSLVRSNSMWRKSSVGIVVEVVEGGTLLLGILLSSLLQLQVIKVFKRIIGGTRILIH